MARHFTEVKVTLQAHPHTVLLVDGTGTSNDGRLNVFACGKFAAGSRPTTNTSYDISALDTNDTRIAFSGVCTFSGETSEFRRS
jgi:hypothetical protein